MYLWRAAHDGRGRHAPRPPTVSRVSCLPARLSSRVYDRGYTALARWGRDLTDPIGLPFEGVYSGCKYNIWVKRHHNHETSLNESLTKEMYGLWRVNVARSSMVMYGQMPPNAIDWFFTAGDQRLAVRVELHVSSRKVARGHRGSRDTRCGYPVNVPLLNVPSTVGRAGCAYMCVPPGSPRCSRVVRYTCLSNNPRTCSYLAVRRTHTCTGFYKCAVL